MTPVSRRAGFIGWLTSLGRRPRYRVSVDMGMGVCAKSSAFDLATARVVACALMDLPGANAEAVVFDRRGVEVERVRRGF